MSTSTWITCRHPNAGDLDIEGMIQIPAQPNDLDHSSGRSVDLSCWHEGLPWRHTKRRRASSPDQISIAATTTCERCRYFQKWSKPGGECRRNAPQAVMISADNDDCEQIAYWPGVDCADWCGEWEARP